GVSTLGLAPRAGGIGEIEDHHDVADIALSRRRQVGVAAIEIVAVHAAAGRAPLGDQLRRAGARDVINCDAPPNSAGPLSPSRSWLTIMMPFATRTLWECQPCGRSMVASLRGWRGSAASTMVVPLGQCMCPIKSVPPSTQTCPPPGQSKCDMRVVFDRLDTKRSTTVRSWGGASAGAQPVLARSSSGDFDDAAGGVATPLFEQVEAFQRGLIAGHEQGGGLPVVVVDVLEPGAARHR